MAESRAKSLDSFDASCIKHFSVCYTKDHLFIGSEKKIFYVDIKEILNQHDFPDFHGKEVKETISGDALKYIPVQQGLFKFKGFIDIGQGNVAMIMEEIKDFNLKFLRIAMVSD